MGFQVSKQYLLCGQKNINRTFFELSANTIIPCTICSLLSAIHYIYNIYRYIHIDAATWSPSQDRPPYLANPGAAGGPGGLAAPAASSRSRLCCFLAARWEAMRSLPTYANTNTYIYLTMWVVCVGAHLSLSLYRHMSVGQSREAFTTPSQPL